MIKIKEIEDDLIKSDITDTILKKCLVIRKH